MSKRWSPTRAGFLDLPGGKLREDPAGTEAASARGQVFYVQGARAWVPAPREAVSPDGSSYAYVDPVSGVHLATVGGGPDKVLLPDSNWLVVEFDTSGIYLTRLAPVAGGYTAAGLYRLPLSGGTPAKLRDGSMTSFVIASGTAWALTGAGADAPPRVVSRIDLATGGDSTWYEAPEQGGFLGLWPDRSGRPVVMSMGPQGVILRRVDSKGHAVELYSGGDRPRPQGTYAADGSGLWLSTFSQDEPFSSPPWHVDNLGHVIQLPDVAPNAVAVAGGCH